MPDTAATQLHRQISFHSPLGKDVLLFKHMTGTEALSSPYCYHLQLQSEKNDIKPKDILGKLVSLHIKIDGQAAREMNGIVTRFFRSGGFDTYTHYQAEVRPWLWLLQKTSDCRIFQQKTVLDIIKEICGKPIYGGLADVDTSLLHETYPRWNYCVQYRETDFHFLCRLMQKVGIYFFFRHQHGKHQMVLVDYHGAHQAYPGYDNIRFATDDTRDAFGDERITEWQESGEIQTASVEINDFDFERVQVSVNHGLRVKQSLAAHGQTLYEHYDYPGLYSQVTDGNLLAKMTLQAQHGQTEVIDGASNARGVACGYVFTLQDHPIADQNQSYLFTSVEYELHADDYETNSGDHSNHDSSRPHFTCRFQAIGREFAYRPPHHFTAPRVYGPQTALVVGKAGEEIWTDKYGRVKVQFHWDRLGQDNEKSSCWVRVAQNWAGKRWGAMFVPRIGMEVVVEFLEGDPDQPLITGCVYNSEAMPPYELPAHQTRSTIKTHSSKNGSGYNELRFEDKKGAEEIYLHAEHDFNRVVKHSDSTQVGFGSKEPGNQSVSVKGDQHTSVGHDQEFKAGNDQRHIVGHDQQTTVENVCMIEAKTAIIFKVGDSIIQIEPGGIVIKGGQLDVNGTANAKYHGGPIVVQAPTVNIN